MSTINYNDLQYYKLLIYNIIFTVIIEILFPLFNIIKKEICMILTKLISIFLGQIDIGGEVFILKMLT